MKLTRETRPWPKMWLWILGQVAMVIFGVVSVSSLILLWNWWQP